MALIHNLHPEILSIIFGDAKSMADEITLAYETGAGKKPEIVAFEIVACGVCTYFREVALATPGLWTVTRVHGASDPENIAQRLGHAGDCWLNIRIDLGAKDLQMDASKLDSIIDNILQHSLRWRTLCIGYGCELRDHPVVVRLCREPAPGLKRLSLTVEDVDTADGTLVNQAVDLPHIFKDGTPELEFIRLRGFALQLFRPPLSTVVILHLDQTRNLPLRYLTLKDILTASPHLAHLSMYGDILSQGSWPGIQKAIDLPSLRSLRVYSISGDGFAGIVTIINAPKLESLTLKGLLPDDLDTLWRITDKNRFEALKSLSLIDFDMRASTCIEMFATFRQITTFSALYTSTGGNEQKFLDALSQGTVGGHDGQEYVPWPKLTTVRLGPDFYVNGQEARKTLIATREGLGHPISTFVFRMNANKMGGASPSMVEAGEGVEVKFCSTVTWPENSTYFDCDDVLFQARVPS